MREIVSLGELLVDFVAERPVAELAAAESFRKAAGGAPANVAVGVRRLGVPAAFAGRVGNDPFGIWLRSVLQDAGVDVAMLRHDPEVRTGLAFVALSERGERTFTFFRNPAADMRHAVADLDLDRIARAQVLHVGSISLIQDPSRATTMAAMEAARSGGALVSYDPNLRLQLWPDEDSARRAILSVWSRAHLIKVSDEELRFLTGADDAAAARSLLHEDLRALLVTRGEGGAEWYAGDRSGSLPGFAVRAVDTTGAGDAFVAAMLSAFAVDPALSSDDAAMNRAVRRANAYAALTTTRPGAIPALASAEEWERFLAEAEA